MPIQAVRSNDFFLFMDTSATVLKLEIDGVETHSSEGGCPGLLYERIFDDSDRGAVASVRS